MTKPKLIVVDDSRSIRAIVRRAFERAGFTVFDTDCGAEALATVIARRPEVVLLDLAIPGLSTSAFIAELDAAREAHGLSFKLLLYSGRLPSELRELCHEYGADGYIEKGHRIQRCIDVVSAMLPESWGSSACL